jgi:hypothetical protein
MDFEQFEARNVNFCITLEFDDEEYLGQKLSTGGLYSLNHTGYGPTRYRPIAVSIVTRTTDPLEDELQLLIWASAQVARLRNLIQWAGGDSSEDPMIPPLPLLLVHRTQWSLYYLEDHREGRRHTGDHRPGATFWRCGRVGDVDTVVGAYQVTAVLQMLMHWAEEVYRPWFEEKILKPCIERNDAGGFGV